MPQLLRLWIWAHLSRWEASISLEHDEEIDVRIQGECVLASLALSLDRVDEEWRRRELSFAKNFLSLEIRAPADVPLSPK
jgi:hypothetical protein